jgi:hypothetical protein
MSQVLLTGIRYCYQRQYEYLGFASDRWTFFCCLWWANIPAWISMFRRRAQFDTELPQPGHNPTHDTVAHFADNRAA